MQDLKGFKVVIAEPMDGYAETYECMHYRGCELVLGPPVSRFELKYTEKEMIELCKDADAILAMTRDPITPALLDACPKLRIISKYGRGIDHLPIDAAAERGILITNTPISHSSTVAEFAFTLIIASMRKLPIYTGLLKKGKWRDTSVGGIELKGKTIGVVGFGAIGKALVKRLQNWEMEILVSDPIAIKEEVEAENAKLVDLEILLNKSDVITLHVPLLPSTKGLIGKKEIDIMKNGVFFVNTSRGALVDEPALIEALKSGKVAGAGLDVFAKEPLDMSSPLRSMENVICTPHESGTAKESSYRISEQGTINCVTALQGEVPEFVVNPAGIEKWKERFCK